MSFTAFLKLYGVALATFLTIDLLWLGFVARSFYQGQLGHLMRASVNWAAAFAFYLLFVVGIVVLIVWPSVQQQSFTRALLHGALLGIVTYAAYDLTNLAILEGFPLKVAVVDILWGAFLCASVCGVTYALSGKIL